MTVPQGSTTQYQIEPVPDGIHGVASTMRVTVTGPGSQNVLYMFPALVDSPLIVYEDHTCREGATLTSWLVYANSGLSPSDMYALLSKVLETVVISSIAGPCYVVSYGQRHTFCAIQLSTPASKDALQRLTRLLNRWRHTKLIRRAYIYDDSRVGVDLWLRSMDGVVELISELMSRALPGYTLLEQ